MASTTLTEPSRRASPVSGYRPWVAQTSCRQVDEPTGILFVCVKNAGRSQMAAAIARQLGGHRVRVRSAGSAPAAGLDKTVEQVLEEIGVALLKEFPKPLTDEFVEAADVVVTMGCGDACPVLPGKRYLDWDLEDPVGQTRAKTRDIRDDIHRCVVKLLAELEIEVGATVNNTG